MTRTSSNRSDAVTSSLHRILIAPETKLSITGMIRASREAVVLIQISWYSDTEGPSFHQTTEPIAVPMFDQWQSFRFDVQAPLDAIALNVYLRLLAPAQGIVIADFDNLRVIEWAPDGAIYGPQYDHALLTGQAELAFTQQVLPGAEQWLTSRLANQNK